MPKYRVIWEIDIEASSPREAACFAREIQEQPENTATVFMVRDKDTGWMVSIDTRPEEKKPMPKYKVCLTRMVEEIASIEVEAVTPEEAVLKVRSTSTADLDWTDGDDMKGPRAYAVMQGEETVWEPR